MVISQTNVSQFYVLLDVFMYSHACTDASILDTWRITSAIQYLSNTRGIYTILMYVLFNVLP